MFLPFRISVDTIDRLTSPSPLRSIRFDKCEENAKDILLSSIDLATGVISGETLKNGWLPVDENYHVFISYSRDDKSKAEKLAKWLTSHGVKCFLDSYYWNNADDLLKAIDDKWCKDKDGYYNYRNRNYTSSLIHAMLSMAIMEAISRCDFGIFIEHLIKVTETEKQDDVSIAFLHLKILFHHRSICRFFVLRILFHADLDEILSKIIA